MHEQDPSEKQDRWRQLAIELGIEAGAPNPAPRAEEESDVGDFRDEPRTRTPEPADIAEDLDDSSPLASPTDQAQMRSESLAPEGEMLHTADDAAAPGNVAPESEEDGPRGRRRRGRRSSRGGRGRRGRDQEGDAEPSAPSDVPEGTPETVAEEAAKLEPVAETEPKEDDVAEPVRRQRRHHGRGRRDVEEEAPARAALEENDEIPDEDAGRQDEEREEVEAVHEEADDDDVEELDDLSDWNVPSWNDLIASLYRPDR